MLAPDPFWFHRKLKRLQVEIISGFEKKSGYTTKLSGFKSYRIQSSHFKFRIQNLRRHDQTGEFLFRIRPLSCKRQKESGTKTFRIHHESGTISSSVNLVSVIWWNTFLNFPSSPPSVQRQQKLQTFQLFKYLRTHRRDFVTSILAANPQKYVHKGW